MSEKLISTRLKSLSESATLAMAVKARELQAQGHKVIKLNLGEPDFQTPLHIKEAAKQALDEGYTFYPPVSGYPELRQAIADKLHRDNQLAYQPAQIVVSTGAKQSLANLMLALLNPEDEVIIFTPYWVTYIEQVKMAEGNPVLLKGGLENDFKITPGQLQKAITPKTRAVLFSSPCNPTGSVYTHEELAGLAAVLEQHPDVLAISDEIYEYINFEGQHQSIAAFESIADRVVIVNGFSKGFAMTGWRLGYMAAPAWLAKACDKVQGQVTSGACSITQRAAIAALNGDMSFTEEMRRAYLRRRDYVKKRLDAMPGIKTNEPKGAFYIFPDVSGYFGKSDGETTISDSYDFTMYLLNQAHVALVNGAAFGADECVRISFAASDEDLAEAMDRMEKALGKLK